MVQRAKNSVATTQTARGRRRHPKRTAVVGRVAGGAAVSAFLAAGAIAAFGVDTAQADTGALGLTCAPNNGTTCDLVTGGSDPGGPLGASVVLLNPSASFRLIGPGGWLIGNGLDALELDPNCTANCVGGNGGFFFGSGGAGAYGGAGGNAGLVGNGGIGTSSNT